MNSEKDFKTLRYIKLGAGGSQAKYCLENGRIRFGFWTCEMLPECKSGDWEAVESRLKEERAKQNGGRAPRSVANDLRQIRDFFEDQGETVWVTFSNRKMFWGRTNGPAYAVENGEDRWTEKKMSVDGWRDVDTKGKALRVDDLSGHLTMVGSYRGTICSFGPVERQEYLVRRLLGEDSEIFETTSNLVAQLHEKIASMIKHLHSFDFEILVEAIFVNTGWTRLGRAGKDEELIDFLMARTAVNGKREDVAIQVKASTNQDEFKRYENSLVETYSDALFVYHSGNVSASADTKVRLLDATSLAPLVVEAGLLQWLLERVR
ncbi:MAG: hypothetical protein AB7F36_11975 [Reyranellaceae bacterium]